MDTLFFIGQVLSLAALAWGAALCLASWDDDYDAEKLRPGRSMESRRARYTS